jgi:hypothetical protein
VLARRDARVRKNSADSFARIGQADRERLAARFEILRALTEDRTMVRVKIEFVVALPLGSEIPDPQVEAVSSAALAIFGPCEFLGSSKVSVRRTRRRSSNVKARE